MRENGEGSAYGRTLSKSLRRTRGLRPAQKAVSDKAAAFREGGRTSPGTRLLTRSFRCRRPRRKADPLLNQYINNTLTYFHIFFKSLCGDGSVRHGNGEGTRRETARPGPFPGAWSRGLQQKSPAGQAGHHVSGSRNHPARRHRRTRYQGRRPGRGRPLSWPPPPQRAHSPGPRHGACRRRF